MTRKNCIFLLFTFFYCAARGQLLLKKEIPVKASFISTDNFGNIYAVSEGDLFKYNADGDYVNSFSTKKTGRISSIDAANPLRILVYAKDFAMAYVFDANLALQSTISLRELNFSDPQLICSSNSASMWVYDRASTVLTKLYENLNVAAQSQPLNLTVKDELNPVMICERDNWLVMLNDKTEFFVFNKEGSYYKTIPADSVSSFTMSDSDLFFLKNGKAFSTNILSGITNEGFTDKNFEHATDIHIRSGHMVVLYPDHISVFDIVQK